MDFYVADGFTRWPKWRLVAERCAVAKGIVIAVIITALSAWAQNGKQGHPDDVVITDLEQFGLTHEQLAALRAELRSVDWLAGLCPEFTN